jgi:hypothetical protein
VDDPGPVRSVCNVPIPSHIVVSSCLPDHKHATPEKTEGAQGSLARIARGWKTTVI